MRLFSKLAWIGGAAGVALGAWTSGAAAQSADEIAVEAAKQYAGTEITIVMPLPQASEEPQVFERRTKQAPSA